MTFLLTPIGLGVEIQSTLHSKYPPKEVEERNEWDRKKEWLDGWMARQQQQKAIFSRRTWGWNELEGAPKFKGLAVRGF